MVEQFGSWVVEWRTRGFSARHPELGIQGTFPFRRIVLPVQIVISESPTPQHRVVLTLAQSPGAGAVLLTGASRPELERFKKRVSGEVLAAVKRSPYGCADCARDAGMIATAWTDAPCPGCHQPYCRNPRCLRRLRVVVRNGIRICKHCGTEPARSRRM